jgi:hypothetical protein
MLRRRAPLPAAARLPSALLRPSARATAAAAAAVGLVAPLVPIVPPSPLRECRPAESTAALQNAKNANSSQDQIAHSAHDGLSFSSNRYSRSWSSSCNPWQTALLLLAGMNLLFC